MPSPAMWLPGPVAYAIAASAKCEPVSQTDANAQYPQILPHTTNAAPHQGANVLNPQSQATCESNPPYLRDEPTTLS